MIGLSRRQFTGLAAAALSGLGVGGCSDSPRLVVVGGGFGGATAAKYLRRHLPGAHVTLIDSAAGHVTCPFSNTVIGGINPYSMLERNFDALANRHGIAVLRDTVAAIDPAARTVRLQGGLSLGYDRLILSPGIAMTWNAIEGYDEAAAEIMPHAWKAGPQTLLLRRQLEAMADGGLVVMSVPGNPFRCPPGPYERASLIAHYLKRHKPRAKLIILDAKESFAKDKLFHEGWAALYPGLIEWVPAAKNGKVVKVEAKAGAVETDFDRFTPAVANIIPPQSAAPIALATGLADKSGFCPVDPNSFESRLVPGIHVIGDSCVAGDMPKSGYSASSQAKACASAIAAIVMGEPPPPLSAINTCYSLLAPDYGVSVAGVYAAQGGSIVNVKGAGGVSPLGASAAFRRKEADYAQGWYASICQDVWG